MSDLSNPGIRQLLQGHIDASGKLPASGAADEYAALFEVVWPDERDRQTYLDGKLKGAKPSYGHMVLASLMKAGQLKLVWTTNLRNVTDVALATREVPTLIGDCRGFLARSRRRVAGRRKQDDGLAVAC